MEENQKFRKQMGVTMKSSELKDEKDTTSVSAKVLPRYRPSSSIYRVPNSCSSTANP